jgi:glycerophosphoryl diester phosphodiesterase
MKENEYGLFIIEGHRGFGNLDNHNTLSSYRKCIENGLDSIELDVWLTTDEKLIVLHGDEKGHPYIELDGKNHNIYELDSKTIRE